MRSPDAVSAKLGSSIARIGIALFLVLVLAHSTSAQEVDAGGTPRTVILEGGSPLAPGDAIRLYAWREEALSADYGVGESGTVVLPMLGRVMVAGVDLEVLHEQLREEYSSQLRSQEIQITFLRRIAVLGAVAAPGLYNLDPTMTLTDVLALAGGATSIGRIDKVKVYRGETDITSVVSVGSPLLRQLDSGDMVYVPEKSWISRYGYAIGASLIAGAAVIYAATIR